MFSGRSTETKRRLYRELVEQLSRADVPAADILTVSELPQDN